MATDHQKKKIEARPRNWFTPVFLVLLRKEPSYGYELMEHLDGFGFDQTNLGTMYRTLRHMEEEGLCKSEWETPEGGGPARRTYSVTDAGEEYLAAWAEDRFFRAYTSVA